MHKIIISVCLCASVAVARGPGRITIEYHDLETVHRLCRNPRAIACSDPPWHSGHAGCRIILSPGGPLEHEMAHCNGAGYEWYQGSGYKPWKR